MHYIRKFGTFSAFRDSYKYKNMEKITQILEDVVRCKYFETGVHFKNPIKNSHLDGLGRATRTLDHVVVVHTLIWDKRKYQINEYSDTSNVKHLPEHVHRSVPRPPLDIYGSVFDSPRISTQNLVSVETAIPTYSHSSFGSLAKLTVQTEEKRWDWVVSPWVILITGTGLDVHGWKGGFSFSHREMDELWGLQAPLLICSERVVASSSCCHCNYQKV